MGLLLIAIMPFVTWRWAKSDPFMAAHFAKDRSISLLSVSNNMGSMVSWSSMSKMLCQQSEIMALPSPMSVGKQLLGGLVGSGGALVGCEAWQACKSHASARCMSY